MVQWSGSMKTYRNLYPWICEFENPYRAYRKARRGKHNRPDVAAFAFFAPLR